MNIAILTSDHNRHKYFANEVAKKYKVVAVVSEEKSFVPLNYTNSKNDEDIINNHFYCRDKQEKKDFDDNFYSNLDVLKVKKKDINSNLVFDFLQSKNIDYIFVYGTGIISNDIIEAYPKRIINMHLGLSPYYRGAGTNFWPFVNSELEFCGVTIHFLDNGIDTGNIISRGRAKVVRNDTVHTLGNKIIKVGIMLICNSLDLISSFSFKSVKQDLSVGKTYYRKDFNAMAIKKIYLNIDSGLLEGYEIDQYKILQDIPIYEA
jgi:phosphoribosylglycinamide formyltransferase 1